MDKICLSLSLSFSHSPILPLSLSLSLSLEMHGWWSSSPYCLKENGHGECTSLIPFVIGLLALTFHILSAQPFSPLTPISLADYSASVGSDLMREPAELLLPLFPVIALLSLQPGPSSRAGPGCRAEYREAGRGPPPTSAGSQPHSHGPDSWPHEGQANQRDLKTGTPPCSMQGCAQPSERPGNKDRNTPCGHGPSSGYRKDIQTFSHTWGN